MSKTDKALQSVFNTLKNANQARPVVSTDKPPTMTYKKLDGSHVDGWQNTMTGVGTSHDKTTYARFRLGVQSYLGYDLLSAMFEHDDLAAGVVDKFPHHMTREGWTLQASQDEADKMKDEAERLNIHQHVKEGMTWGRLYGGAITIIGAIDGNMADAPLNEEGIEEVAFLNTVDCCHVQVAEYVKDPLAPNFGEPELYRFNIINGDGTQNRDTQLIHSSRVIRWRGAQTTELHRRLFYKGWDASVLVRVYDVLRDFAQAFNGVSAMLAEANLGVMKIDGFLDMITSNEKETLQTRMQLIDMAKSMIHSLVLDAESEDFARYPAQFAGIADVLDRFMMRMSSAARVPVTVLFGRSPAGMNATGESDMRSFYDEISSAQRKELRPQLMRLYKLIMSANKGPFNGLPDKWDIEFNSLWQQTPEEESQERKTRAEADAIYLDREVVSPEEVRTRFGEGSYNRNLTVEDVKPDDTPDVEALLAAQKAELESQQPKGENKAPEDETNTVGKLQLAPTDIAVVVTVNEARNANGLGPLKDDNGQDDPDGKLTIAEFKTKKQAKATLEGEEAADVEKPKQPVPPVPPIPNPQGQGNSQTPSVPPSDDEQDDEQDEGTQ